MKYTVQASTYLEKTFTEGMHTVTHTASPTCRLYLLIDMRCLRLASCTRASLTALQHYYFDGFAATSHLLGWMWGGKMSSRVRASARSLAIS